MTRNNDFVLYGEFRATLHTENLSAKAIEMLRGEGFLASVFDAKKIPNKFAISVECTFRPDQLPEIKLSVWEWIRHWSKRHDFDITAGEAQMLLNAIEYIGYVSDPTMPVSEFVETERRTHIEEDTPSCKKLYEDLKHSHYYANRTDFREYLDLKTNVATQMPTNSDFVDPLLNFWDFATKCQRLVDGLGEGRFQNTFFTEFPYFIEMKVVNPELYLRAPDNFTAKNSQLVQDTLDKFSEAIRVGLDGELNTVFG